MEGGRQQSGCLITLEQICNDNEDNNHDAYAFKILTLEHDPLYHAMDNGTPYPMPTNPLDDHNIHD